MPIPAARGWRPCCGAVAARAEPDGPDASDGVGRLPAPYQDPLLVLGRDLAALAASLRLRLRELVRRNRQGDLALPAGWPRSLAPLFWPLLLALILLALIALPLAIAPRSAGEPAEAPPPAAPSSAPAVGEASAAKLAEIAEIAPVEATAAVSGPPPAPAAPPAPVPPPDPLLSLLNGQDPRQLIRQAEPVPAAGLLRLELAPLFPQLPQQQRQEAAERWLAQSQAQGYDHLLLVDAGEAVLGRQALVGSGMILFDPPLRR